MFVGRLVLPLQRIAAASQPAATCVVQCTAGLQVCVIFRRIVHLLLTVTVLGLSVWRGPVGPMVFGRGHSIGTTGLLLRTILCKSLVLMPRVKFVEKYTKHAC